MTKEKLLNWVHLFLMVFSTGLIASIENLRMGINLAILAMFLVIISERFFNVKIKHKYFTVVPFLALGGVGGMDAAMGQGT